MENRSREGATWGTCINRHQIIIISIVKNRSNSIKLLFSLKSIYFGLVGNDLAKFIQPPQTAYLKFKTRLDQRFDLWIKACLQSTNQIRMKSLRTFFLFSRYWVSRVLNFNIEQERNGKGSGSTVVEKFSKHCVKRAKWWLCLEIFPARTLARLWYTSLKWSSPTGLGHEQSKPCATR